MPEQNVTLTLAFLEKHPRSASHILEQHDFKKVANFFTQIPHSYVAKVVQHMMPDFTAHICKNLEVGAAAGILSSLETSLIATVLRFLETRKRKEILEVFPLKTRVACNLLLRFSQKTVGAWMTPHVSIISDDCTIKEALHILSNAGEIVHTDSVFVVNRERVLKGYIHYIDLLRSDPERPVNLIVEVGGKSLSGHTSLKQASTYNAWNQVDMIPVVNRKNEFIGALRHVDLRKGLNHLEAPINNQDIQDHRSDMVTIYSQSMLAIFQTMNNIIIESDITDERSQ